MFVEDSSAVLVYNNESLASELDQWLKEPRNHLEREGEIKQLMVRTCQSFIRNLLPKNY